LGVHEPNVGLDEGIIIPISKNPVVSVGVTDEITGSEFDLFKAA
jgi:hypothetical protein